MQSRLAIPWVMTLALASPTLWAKDTAKAGLPKGPEVVAHLALNATATVHMYTRREAKGRLYLYALHSSGEVSVVDITEAARPALITQTAAAGATYANAQQIGTNTALVEIADASSAATSAKTLALLDTSNPLAPQMTLRFAGVTAVSRDDSRSLLFIANSEGLWIVRHYEPPDVGVAAWENFVSAR